MKKLFMLAVAATFTLTAFAQRQTTTSAIIVFDATTPIDDLPKAENKTVIAALDPSTGSVQFEAGMRNFAFTNPMIQDHFNQKNWLDSEAFPKATFKGQITNLSAVDFKKSGTYKANVEGVLTIKGKEQKVSTPATIIVNGNSITAKADFVIKLADFGIEGGAIKAGKVAAEPRISVTADFSK